MATREPTPTATMHRMHTEVAVLQAHMSHIDEKVQQARDEIKDIKKDVKHLEEKIDDQHKDTAKLFKEMKDENNKSHNELTEKITSLEKWKWMIMGGCAALGAIATELVKLL